MARLRRKLAFLPKQPTWSELVFRILYALACLGCIAEIFYHIFS